jgi:hypothetical protein
MFPLALYFVLPKVVLLERIQVSQYWELYDSMFGDYTFILGSLQIFKKRCGGTFWILIGICFVSTTNMQTVVNLFVEVATYLLMEILITLVLKIIVAQFFCVHCF